MTIASIVLAAAAVLASAAAPSKAPPVSNAPWCDGSAGFVWTKVRGRSYAAEAFANGKACASAVVTIVVRAPDGKVIWAEAHPADSLMTFAGVKTRGQMTAMLAEWISQQHTFRSTAGLPVWKKGADAPEAGEFPFYPDDGIDRETYEQIRGERQPVFCYVQGMESLACLGLSKDGALTKIGLQTFPG